MKKTSKKSGCVSGGFDPLHIGHIELFERASKLGSLTVIINGDYWLMRKKGKVFMPLEDRVRIIQSIRWVDKVYPWVSMEDDVCNVLGIIMPDIFANGGDRKEDIPEFEKCKRLGIKMVFGLGEKIRSSSELLNNYEKNSS